MKYPVKSATFKVFPFLTLFCLLAFKSFSQSDPALQYVQKYKAIAEEEMERTGVPAAISLAQGIIESQSGQGWLVEHSHNHFGIKCKSNWTGPTIHHDDDHKNDCFRVYATDDSSWRDHSDFLKSTPRYSSLFQLDPLNYKAWAHGLKKAGYATNKKYARELINTIETYHLQQYSRQALALVNHEPQNDFAAMLDQKISQDRREMNGQLQKKEANSKTDTITSPYPVGLFHINGRRVLYLPQGTQLISVAEKYHIRLQRLLGYNELQNDVLPRNMLVYLEKKRKTSGKRFWYKLTHLFSKKENTIPDKKNDQLIPVVEQVSYEVKKGDTLYGISRKYGTTVEQIQAWNNLTGNNIHVGQKLIVNNK